MVTGASVQAGVIGGGWPLQVCLFVFPDGNVLICLGWVICVMFLNQVSVVFFGTHLLDTFYQYRFRFLR